MQPSCLSTRAAVVQAYPNAAALQIAVGVFYLLGALCWITNATWSGWPSANSTLNDHLTGTTAVVGAMLFHLGAMCQVNHRACNAQQKQVRASSELAGAAARNGVRSLVCFGLMVAAQHSQ